MIESSLVNEVMLAEKWSTRLATIWTHVNEQLDYMLSAAKAVSSAIRCAMLISAPSKSTDSWPETQSTCILYSLKLVVVAQRPILIAFEVMLEY